MIRLDTHEAARPPKATSMLGALDDESLLRLTAACRVRTYRRGQDPLGTGTMWQTGWRRPHEVWSRVVVASEQGEELLLVTAGGKGRSGRLSSR